MCLDYKDLRTIGFEWKIGMIGFVSQNRVAANTMESWTNFIGKQTEKGA